MGTIIEKSRFPPNHVFYNPSTDQDGEYVYLRNTEAFPTHEQNHFILYKMATEELMKINIGEGMLLPTYSPYRGIEDARIVKFEGRVWFTATSTHASAEMQNTALLGYLDASTQVVEYMTVLDNFAPPAKNICPFVYKDTLCILDAYGQKVYKVQKEENGNYVATFWKELRNHTNVCAKYRGSTSPIYLHGNTWAYIVHDVIFNDSASRHGTKLAYKHLYIEFDIERGAITFVSTPFWLMHFGIEFVSGLIYDAKKDAVKMYFGVKDEAPCLCTTTLYNLRCGKM